MRHAPHAARARHPRVRALASVVTLIATLLAALGSIVGIASPAGAATTEVSVNTLSFSPKNVTINAGDTVRWTQRTAIQHDIVADDESFVSHPNCPPTCMGNGDTYSHTFTTPGVYRYYCDLHGSPGGFGMAGTITVQGPVDRDVTVHWSAPEYARLQQIGDYLGQSPAEAQKTAVFVVGFLLGLSGNTTPEPATLDGPGTDVAVTSSWPAIDVGVLDAVKAKFVLNDEDAHRLGVYFISFLLALGGQ